MNPLDIQFEVLEEKVLSGFLHKERTNKRAVLFVHGFMGDSEKTWVADAPQQSFPELIAHDPDLPDFDVFAFSYRTTAFAGDSIEQIARQLGDIIDGPLLKYRVILVAHSMGGLVCMRYILDRLERGHKFPILGLLMYGTPTTGTELVNISNLLRIGLRLAVPWLDRVLSFYLKTNRQLKELAVASHFLQKLHDEWALRVVNGGDPDEDPKRRAWLPVRMVTGTMDWVVPERSAKGVYGEIDWHPISFSHVDLVKPGIRTDTRYRLAQEFFEKCRASTDSEVLTRLRAISDSVWKTHEGKIIRDWEYEVEIHGGNAHPMDPSLQQAGFSPCAVKKCRYATNLQNREFLIGVSFGLMASKRVWEKQPLYVHQMSAATTGEEDRSRLAKAIDEVLTQSTSEQAWDIFFPSLSVSVSSGSQKSKFPLTAGTIEHLGSSLLRTYTIPSEAIELAGEEVVIHLSYESIVPQSLTSFHIMFPWLTYRCTAQVTIYGELEFLTINRRLSGEQEVEVLPPEILQHKGEVLVSATNLVLPNSSVEIRWQQKL